MGLNNAINTSINAAEKELLLASLGRVIWLLETAVSVIRDISDILTEVTGAVEDLEYKIEG